MEEGKAGQTLNWPVVVSGRGDEMWGKVLGVAAARGRNPQEATDRVTRAPLPPCFLDARLTLNCPMGSRGAEH